MNKLEKQLISNNNNNKLIDTKVNKATFLKKNFCKTFSKR